MNPPVAVTNSLRPFVSGSGVQPEPDTRRDRDLFAHLATGRQDALGEIYDRHAASLYRHALALARLPADAEDLVQAVFVKLATTGADLLGVRTPASYLHWMLRTTWVDARRRAVASERAEQGASQPLAGPSRTLIEGIDISRAVDELPPTQREVIVLHLVEGFSFREVGRMTGVSLFTAAARYRLAIGRLRRRLAPNRKDPK